MFMWFLGIRFELLITNHTKKLGAYQDWATSEVLTNACLSMFTIFMDMGSSFILLPNTYLEQT